MFMPIPPARKTSMTHTPEPAPAQSPMSGDLQTHSGIDAHGALHTAMTQELLLASIGAAEAVYMRVAHMQAAEAAHRASVLAVQA